MRCQCACAKRQRAAARLPSTSGTAELHIAQLSLPRHIPSSLSVCTTHSSFHSSFLQLITSTAFRSPRSSGVSFVACFHSAPIAGQGTAWPHAFVCNIRTSELFHPPNTEHLSQAETRLIKSQSALEQRDFRSFPLIPIPPFLIDVSVSTSRFSRASEHPPPPSLINLA